MNLSDETLSAFLDAELPEQEMEQVRMALIDNEDIAERLAELAMVDAMVQEHYQAIDLHPIPAATQALLTETQSVADNPVTNSPVPDNVVAFPWWRKAQQHVQQYAAAIAIIVLIAGYGFYQVDSPNQTGLTTQNHSLLPDDISEPLSYLPSGIETMLDDDSVMTIQLSFYNPQGQLCRQYAVQDHAQQSSIIACEQQGQWQQIASVEYNVNPEHQTQYQTASGASALDDVLDQLIADAPLTLTQEQQALNQLANGQ